MELGFVTISPTGVDWKYTQDILQLSAEIYIF